MIDLTKIPKQFSHWPFWDIISKKALQHDIDPLVIASVIKVESNGIPTAFRYEKNYKWTHDPKELARRWKVSVDSADFFQKCSFGLMQVMGAVAVEHGLNDIIPYNQPTILVLPEYGIEFGCRHWKKFEKKYNKPTDIYSAYNAGSVRKNDVGDYENYKAVLRFHETLEEFKLCFQT